jgi:hypothetical protein
MTTDGHVSFELILAVDDPVEELEAARAWLAQWAPGTPDEGCGCCVSIFNIRVPAESVAQLPEPHRSAALQRLTD